MTDAAQVVYLDQCGSDRFGHGDPHRWTRHQWADDVAACYQGTAGTSSQATDSSATACER